MQVEREIDLTETSVEVGADSSVATQASKRGVTCVILGINSQEMTANTGISARRRMPLC